MSAEMIEILALHSGIRFASARPHRSASSVEQWCRQIRSVRLNGTTHTFERAKVVCQGRQTLARGARVLMGSFQMPFSKRTTDKLPSIGQHLGGLTEVQNPEGSAERVTDSSRLQSGFGFPQ